MRLIFTLFFVLLFSVKIKTQAQPTITLTEFASGLTTVVDITNCGDERLFAVQKGGKIKIVDLNGNVTATPFLDIDPKVKSNGNEQGLLGLAFHPDYATNGYLYVNYTRETDAATVVARYERDPNDPNKALPDSELILLVIDQPYSNHNGGCIKFGPDGYLYIGMGDGGSGGDPDNYAQNPLEHLGKMLRIDVDNGNPYGIPASNPYYGQTDTLPEIWALGLRNPWRFSFDALLGDMWIGDVGQGNLEEVDYQPAASTGAINYGWRCKEGTATYNAGTCVGLGTLTDPVFEFSHANGNCSITGGFVYRGVQFGDMYGYYLVTDYCSGRFWALYPDGPNSFDSYDLGVFNTYQYVGLGEDIYGELYIAGHSSNKVYKISEANDCNPIARIISPGGVVCEGDYVYAQAGKGFTYTFYVNNVAQTPQSDPFYPVLQGINSYKVKVTNTNNCSNTSSAIFINGKDTPSPVISGPTEACLGVTATYSVENKAGFIYQWTVTGGTIVSGQGSSSIVVNWVSSNGTIDVVVTNP
ncbi:MAG: PQQ-dependent sugar dehydrogenase [Chitinophagales bacterium]|jgi:glucose/arabinose dehydrogenase|nr:PQQ-dependent sugar dehydrogenase [Sphingobacteriales bacterium]MBP9142338.1 PQQ-dependent sugar dehydrogenase [Chitinophagales bacterium]MDA0199549.1 PQQ-dependent sugar dehydrogenase [Bacteroidota bacterium]MBK6891356.1 PQQ-dependent sugar dehydrogenase [Sphingobacteriales bacterium]MBK8677302.1 PQQ-dependent sugar dehydrogenase [Sphingobacteriales bacterium]